MLGAIDGLKIGSEGPGRTRTARVVLSQEPEEREIETAFGKSAWAVMTCRATARKKLGGRFTLIEILGMSHTDQHNSCSGNEETAPQFYPVPQVQTPLVMSGKCRLS